MQILAYLLPKNKVFVKFNIKIWILRPNFVSQTKGSTCLDFLHKNPSVLFHL